MAKHSLSICVSAMKLDSWRLFCSRNSTRDMRQDMGVALFTRPNSFSFIPPLLIAFADEPKGKDRLPVVYHETISFILYNQQCFES